MCLPQLRPRPPVSLRGVPTSLDRAQAAQVRDLLSSGFPGPSQVLYHLTDLLEEETEDPSLGDWAWFVFRGVVTWSAADM